ncbi:MAG: hypothetical protein M4579_005446 [Chaenotheca gracillima]|nr:MAG: hypothetical protein M4579_005446 [Chaenotheca gracillima]
MHLESLANELVLQVFCSCASVQDALNLAATCHRFHKVFGASQRLPILWQVAETEYGPIDEAVQLVTHNDSQPAHLIRNVPLSFALFRQILAVGKMARRWEEIYPIKKWKYNFEDRRLLTDGERYSVRRAIYRLWLYGRAFHNRNHPRFSRQQRPVMLERAELLHNWTTADLAEIEDVREVVREVLQNQVCPSNGTIQRKFRKRFPDTDQQLLFNIHLNYPPPPASELQYQTHHQQQPAVAPTKQPYYNKYLPTLTHEPGAEGWGDEIPHYYVVEDMLKLDPAQILWLKDNAPLKGQVETYVRSLGEWFENNGETFAPTLEWVMKERGLEIEEVRAAIRAEEMGVAICV